ncbi:MAG: response regulator transcription factor [Acidimicrobiales bacterium]
MAPAATKARVLVVDDDENIRYLLHMAVQHAGFEVADAGTGREALTAVDDWHPDLVLLDVMLPDLDGFEVCRRLRTDRSTTPVIFLTARDELDDRLRGLTIGGDDYVTKPFSLEEVVARIQVVLRRSGALAGDDVLRYADVELDDDAHQVRRAGRLVDLSPTEFKLLRHLLVNAERVLSRDQIVDRVWQYDYLGGTNIVETYISYLRRKLGDPPLIQTVRGIGYVLREQE